MLIIQEIREHRRHKGPVDGTAVLGPPILSLPPPRGTARTTSVVTGVSTRTEHWSRGIGPPQHASERTSAIAASGCPQAPSAAAQLGVCAAAPGGARPAFSRDAAARIAPIASGSSTGRYQPQPPAAARARQHVDVERAPHQRRPRPVARGGPRRVGRLGARARHRRRRAVGHHPRSPAAVRRQHAVVDHQVDPRPWDQRRQLLQQRERLEEQPPRAIRPRALQREHEQTVATFEIADGAGGTAGLRPTQGPRS